MARLPSDDPSLASVRVRVARSGGTRRPCVRVPDDEELDGRLESGSLRTLDVDAGDLVRVVIDRNEYHARVDADTEGRLLRGAFDNRRLARASGEGDNRLVDWLTEHGREPGDALLLDVVAAGDAYGLRLPGERTVYDVDAGPRDSLSEIARDVDG